MSAPGPAFQFYPGDFLKSTAGWTGLERWAYIALLCSQWEHGAVPQDSERCRRIAEVESRDWPEVWAMLEPKFPSGENPRMAFIRGERLGFIESQREKSAKGVAARRSTSGSTHGSTRRCTSSSSLSSSSSISSSASEEVANAPAPAGSGAAQIFESSDRKSPQGTQRSLVGTANTETPAGGARHREKRAPKRKRGSKICPDAYQLTIEIENWARINHPGVDIPREFEKFKNHEFANTRTDWDRCLRNWIIRADEMGPRRTNGSGKLSKEQQRTENHRRLYEKAQRGEL